MNHPFTDTPPLWPVVLVCVVIVLAMVGFVSVITWVAA